MTLTVKETKAFMTIIDQALQAMGGDEPKDLLDDNFSWFNETDLTAGGFSKHQAAGLMSSLEKKGLIENYEPGHEFGWAISDEGINEGQLLFGR